jgi:hypothetical protein
MPVGSTYSTLKTAIYDKLKARPALSAVAVNYRAPEKATEVQGESGSREAIFLDDAEGEHDNVVFGGLPLRLEETYSLKLVIQVLRKGDSSEQQDADRRVDELLYEVLHELASDPTFGIDDDAFDYLQVTYSDWKRTTGFLDTSGGHAAGCELDLQVEARLSFD